MRLSKRIGLTYLIALVIAIFVCISFFTVFINTTREGDRLRSAEISQGVRFRMDGKVNNIREESKLCKRLIDIQTDTDDDCDFIDNLSTDDVLSNVKVDFNGVVNIDTNEISKIFKDGNLDYSAYKTILYEITEYIKTSNVASKCGIFTVDSENYIISYEKLNDNSKYVILIRNIDKDFLEDIGISTGSRTHITNEVGVKLNGYGENLEGTEYIFEEDSEEIYSYSSIPTLNKSESLYLKVGQYKEVEKTITNNLIKLIFIILMFIIAINAALYSFIYRKVIKRIIFVNDSVHKVEGDNFSSKKIATIDIEDEITDLTISINDMLDRVNYANSRVKASETKYRGIINTMTNSFIYCKIILDNDRIDGIIVDINDAAKDILNLSDWNGKTISSIFREFQDCNEIVLDTVNDLKQNSHLVIDKEVELANNRWGFITITMIEEEYFFIIINDVTKIKVYSEEMTYLASYDPLTSIYNRRKLLNYIEDLEKHNRSYNFFYMDLDDFKKINDSLGHDKGDAVLKDVSQNLAKLSCDNIKIARLGGDEFVVIMEGTFDESEILGFGDEVISLMNRSYHFNEFIYDLKLSIGVASYPKDGQDSNTIIKYADIAMYNSKLKGGNTISIFNDEILELHELENKIKEGMSREEFIPYFQPIYNVKENKIDGVEALVRWNSNSGILTPDKFISVAKRNELMAEIDKNMFCYSCKFSCRWKERYGEFAYISVNISNSLLLKKEFLQFILGTLQEYDIPTKYIKLEITEDEIIKDIQYVVSILEYLRDFGVKIALDDFGTGYSSYNYINTLPVDIIKIDRSLIINIEYDEKAYSIVQSLIELSKSLELETICEGIENKAQLDILSELGCDKIQGFVFSRPIPENKLFDYIDEFERILVDGK